VASNKLNYIAKYNKENYKMYQFRIRKDDSDIIEKLDSVSNRNNYITKLIRENISSGVLTIKQIKQLIKPVISKYQIEEVFLFGSYARGEANSNSDVDIYCYRGKIRTLYDLTDFKEDLENALGKKVDVVTIGSQMDDSFRKHLEEDKIKIC
jgi:predicted nucleotidyltransferase